ncbi:unnamed protein product [Spirodela intermedia]|uniref:intramembrane prenyl-peptidase Rce1 n=1 Tax=Spirodela intermedia TaxID=51605 RepID=A0A7I8J0G6_SPIIN|nr:unnamed protein product [Spirodela intermedia]CAA6663724.1 unnamed protein product [Spirodela intermedia]
MDGGSGASVSGAVAVGACSAMSLLYVGILYAPGLILRLPPPKTVNSFLIRRFICLWGFEPAPSIFGIFGIRLDHLWRAVFIPTLLTSLVYTGSLVSKVVIFFQSPVEAETSSRWSLMEITGRQILDSILNVGSNMLFWRSFLVAPVTEEIVFRACMIPLLLCGGFKTLSIIFFSPIFFSLAHLNHFLELYCQRGYSFLRASMVVGLQLGYTVIFGGYASFLFLRTGNLICPVMAHVFCNMMGLPAVSSSQAKACMHLLSRVDEGRVRGGCGGLPPGSLSLTSPDLYNESLEECRCWHGRCGWD